MGRRRLEHGGAKTAGGVVSPRPRTSRVGELAGRGERICAEEQHALSIRAACERLQRELAPQFDLSGYIVS